MAYLDPASRSVIWAIGSAPSPSACLAEIVFVDSIPKSASGKSLRRVLAERWARREERIGGPTAHNGDVVKNER
jgi:acyl-coenzyme A synthetase/AMP-(fatty) acid ligase